MDFDGSAGRPAAASIAASSGCCACDTPEPSVFAHDILNARPYAFLDDAPLEERRAHAVQTRGSGRASAITTTGVLDADAIARVRERSPSRSDGTPTSCTMR